MLRHFSVVSEPYEFEKLNVMNNLIEVVKIAPDNVNEDRTLSKMIKGFLSNSK